MKKMKTMTVAIALVSVLLMLAGCGSKPGGSSSGSSSSKSSGTTSSSSSAKSSSSTASTVTINLGADTTFPPFESEKGGKVTGFDIDMIRAIAKDENFKLHISTMNFTGLIPAVKTDQIDVAVAGITIKKSRMKAVNFSNAYYKSGLSILVKKSDAGSVKTLQDLVGKTVATKKGTSSVDKLNTVKGIKVRQFDNIDDAYNELLNGGADAVVFDNPVNINFMSSHKNVTTVGDLLTGEYYGIAVNKSKTDLLKKINDGLDKIRKDGTYDTLYKKYFGADKNGKVETDIAPDKAALNS